MKNLEETINNIHEERTEIIKTIASIDSQAFEYYLEAYASFPSAEGLDGEKYSNFLAYKIIKSYEMTREKFPSLPILYEENITYEE